MIRLANLDRYYETGPTRTYVLRRINLDIREGEFLTIMGPSGAGKSTLLSILGMLDNAWTGEYWFLDQALHGLSQKKRVELNKKYIGFVFQKYHLIDDLTVYENLEIPLSYRDIKPKERAAIVAETLDRFQIVGKKDLYPSQLSGGQQQLVGVARAVIASPKLLLADEPTGNLHSAQGEEIMELFTRLNRQGTTIVQVTHSERNASYGHRTIQLHDGWIVEEAGQRGSGAGGEGRGKSRRPRRPTAPPSRYIHTTVPTSPPTPHVLVADDQPHVREALRLLLKGEGYDIQTAASPAGVLSAVQAADFDAVLLDLNYARDTTTGREGLELVSQLQSLDATLPTVVMTAWGSIEKAVEAMRRGARDFIEKPWDNNRLLATLSTQVELGRALRNARRLESENRLLRRDGAPELIAQSAVMRPVLQLMERVAASDANVLLSGEHGTGKEVVAQWLHAASPRAARPYVAVNLGGLSEGLFESEMFGHVKGAFTDARADRIGRFELAEGGTLLLDEIGTMAPRQQAKLLRVLETSEVERVGASRSRRIDVRILSATNADLAAEVTAGRFREDLLFRLNTIEIRLPALRERREDIRALADHFLRRYAARYRKALVGFEADALEALEAHAWPGNVRELDHTLERAVLMAQGNTIRAPDLGLRLAQGAAPRLEDLPLEEVERLLVRKALERHGGNVSQAARALGLSRSALYRRLQHYGL